MILCEIPADENSDADDSDKEAQDENELDKQLGDVGAESEKLDEKLWGSDDEEEDDAKEVFYYNVLFCITYMIYLDEIFCQGTQFTIFGFKKSNWVQKL